MTAATRAWLRALQCSAAMSGRILPQIVEEVAARQPARPAFLAERETVTWGTFQDRIDRYARWAADMGMAGETIALLLPNSSDYPAAWLGLSRIGCKVALLNTNLKGQALAYGARIAGASHVISHDTVSLPGCRSWRLADVQAHRGGATAGLHAAMPDDTALYIYTSGTTGLPKAVRISHARVVEWSSWFAGMTGATAEDRLYDCLPMYHSTGGVVAVGTMLMAGGSVVVRERFSAGRFWEDVTNSGCTMFQYIGELCRYLVQQPHHPLERRHMLRLAVGNGLRHDVWEPFRDRFAIPAILEFYAATEGQLSLYNVEGRPGAIGRIPPFLHGHTGAAIIRCGGESHEPVRAADGFCIRCGPGEAGEAISRLKQGFAGYTDPAASRAKVLCDVFAAGDRWYRTGDLMRQDADGFFYFVDRLGDTFRWKGENVSTEEVAAVLRRCPGVRDVTVYGVTIPAQDGRAGMAAIVTEDGFDWDRLAEFVQRDLPAYARPQFVRICAALPATATFKTSKALLARDGIGGGGDPVRRHVAGCGYVPVSD